ncbi:MAG: hypothetical protein AB7I38_17045 [Dehalococcoidia bacterium]
MALLDAYATAAEYRAMVGDGSTGSDSTLDAQLLGMSRLLERSLQVAVGQWNAHTGTYVFDGSGKAELSLRDRDGRAYFLRSIDPDLLEVDADLDGTYEYTLDTGDAWVRGLPENAAALSEPFRAIELRPLSGALLTAFPALPGCVRITGAWAWAAVPRAVKDLVIHRTHEVREALKAGATMQLPSFEGALPMQPKTAWLWHEAERLYGRRLPGIG